jgi:hypothetical protein
MAYITKLESWKKVELQNAGVTIHVHRNGVKFGRLEVGKGGIRWLGAGKSKKGPNLSWTELVRQLGKK